MKKLLLLALALCGATFGAKAQTSFSVAELTVLNGRTGNIAVKLNNSAPVRDIMFEVTLPEGVTVADTDESSLTSRADGYTVARSDAKGSTYTYIVYNAKGNSIAAGNDVVLNIPVTVNVEAENLWKDLATEVAESSYTTSDGTVVTETAIADVNFNVVPALLGDVDKDKEIGVGDIAGVADIIANGSSSTYAKVAADTDGDQWIGVGDISAIANYVATHSW